MALFILAHRRTAFSPERFCFQIFLWPFSIKFFCFVVLHSLALRKVPFTSECLFFRPCFLGRLRLKCCFTSTETVGLLRTGAQDVHLDFHTAPEFWVVFHPALILEFLLFSNLQDSVHFLPISSGLVLEPFSF